MNRKIFTIGHSNLSLEEFMRLIAQHGVTAVSDVRSQPVSAYTPHFSRNQLAAALSRKGIPYVFMGNYLGGRSTNEACYQNGRLQYSRVMHEQSFQAGIERVKTGMLQYRVALMCSEKEPLGCHRALLVGRRLHEDGICVEHILSTGQIESHTALETRMLELCKIPEGDMFRDRKESVADAYQIQGDRVAYLDHQLPVNPLQAL